MARRAWRRTRVGARSGVSGFYLTICAAHVVKSADIAHTVSSNQMFKLVMAFLKDTDFRNKKVVFGNSIISFIS